MHIQGTKLISDINDLIFEWQKKGLVASSNEHQSFRKSKNRTEITWKNDGYVLKDETFASVSEYCALIEKKQYSMLLSDGAFFQISYTLERDRIVKHRLCWYPAPIELTTEIIDNESIIDFILQKMNEGALETLRLRSPIRFDYAPDDTKDRHPTVHMHISHEDCRIPVRSPLCLRDFMIFIVDNFYPDLIEITSLYERAGNWNGQDTLTNNEKSKLHMNIFKMAAT